MRLTNRFLIVTFILYLAINLSHAIIIGKTVYGDGRFYFSWLRSAVVSHDLDFTDEYQELGATQLPAKEGKPGNKYAVGPSIAWGYPYLSLYRLRGGSGFELSYQITLGVTGVLYTAVALLLLTRLLIQKFPPSSAIAAGAAIAWTTNLLFYGAVDTVNSHGLSFAAAVLFLLVLEKNPIPCFTAGSVLGFIFLIRPQDTIYGLLLLPYLNCKNVRVVIGGFLPAIFSALILNYFLYRNPIPAYFLGGEGFRLQLQNLPGLLFSPEGGLLIFTPSLILAVWGLFKLQNHINKPKPHYRLFIPLIVIQVLVISSWSTWSQGASYGNRMTVGLLPVFAYGFAGAFRTLYRYRFRFIQTMSVIVLPLAILNTISIIYYLATH